MRCKRKRDKKATAENFLVVILASGIKANLKFLIVQRLHQTLPVDQRTTIGVPLLPRVSRAFTVNVCFPSGKSGVVYIPLVPVPQSTLRPSNVHSKSACSSDSHVIVCLGLLVSPGFLLVMDITGAFVSKNEEIGSNTDGIYTRTPETNTFDRIFTCGPIYDLRSPLVTHIVHSVHFKRMLPIRKVGRNKLSSGPLATFDSAAVEFTFKICLFIGNPVYGILRFVGRRRIFASEGYNRSLLI